MIYGIVLLGILYSSVAFAQQSLTLTQQCENHQQELVLSDITYQELRARCGNIMRQAYDLETEVRKLKEENAKLKEEIASLKAGFSELKDVPTKTD